MNQLFAAVMDSTKIEKATATEYLTTNLIQFFAALLIMFLLASALLTILKIATSRTKSKLAPNASDNTTTVQVIICILPNWAWVLSQFVFIAFAIIAVRGMFGSPVKFQLFTQEGVTAVVEMILAYGILLPTVPKFGIRALEALGKDTIKGWLGKGVGGTIVTPDEYMDLGTPKP